jgi:predicted RNA-binding protein
MLIETVNTKRLFFNELSIYRKNDSERINKDFIITKTSKVHQSIETRQCRIFDQSSRMRLEKILFALTSKEV